MEKFLNTICLEIVFTQGYLYIPLQFVAWLVVRSPRRRVVNAVAVPGVFLFSLAIYSLVKNVGFGPVPLFLYAPFANLTLLVMLWMEHRARAVAHRSAKPPRHVR